MFEKYQKAVVLKFDVCCSHQIKGRMKSHLSTQLIVICLCYWLQEEYNGRKTPWISAVKKVGHFIKYFILCRLNQNELWLVLIYRFRDTSCFNAFFSEESIHSVKMKYSSSCFDNVFHFPLWNTQITARHFSTSFLWKTFFNWNKYAQDNLDGEYCTINLFSEANIFQKNT